MRLEVVDELPRGEHDCIQYLLYLGVSNFGLSQDFTDEVDRSLSLLDVPLLLSFDDESGTDHVMCGGDVEQQFFLESGWDQYRGLGQEISQLVQSLLCFRRPMELILLL